MRETATNPSIRASRQGEAEALALSIGAVVIGGFALAYMAAYLTVIAANGTVSATKFYYPGSVIGSVQLLIVYATVGLLIGIPHQAFKRGLDRNGNDYARRTLVGFITVGACALTATYLVLAHLSGPLQTVKSGPVAVGILFAIALIAPYYRTLALACWRRGIGGIFNWRATIIGWRNAATEVQALPKHTDEAKNLSVDSDSKSSKR
jgi:hypothetical protein